MLGSHSPHQSSEATVGQRPGAPAISSAACASLAPGSIEGFGA